ncbi:MAG: hypothetical protein WC455_16700 [Dehalococcoidia bacterium]
MKVCCGRYDNQYQFGASMSWHRHGYFKSDLWHFHVWLDFGPWYVEVTIGGWR